MSATSVSGRPLAIVRRPRAVHLYVLAGAAAIGFYFLTPSGSLLQALVYELIGLSAAVALFVGARLNLEASARAPWYLFGVGMLGFVAGDSILDYYLQTGGEAPFPSAADGAYLAAYPVFFAGMFLLIRRFGGLESRFALVDATIVTCAFALAQWVFLIEPATHTSGGTLARSFTVAYPVMDILLVAPLARLLVTPVVRTASFGLIVLAIAVQLVADDVYYNGYATYHWLDGLWLASYVAWGAAALHPSIRRLGRGQIAPDPRLSLPQVTLLAISLGTPAIALLIQAERGQTKHLVMISVGAIVIGALVLLRIAGLVRALGELRNTERAARLDAEAAHATLSDQNEELRELDRLKDEFVGLVTHDLRTPLTSISGYVELLQSDESGDLDDEQRHFLEIVSRNADRLLRLVNDLLFAARLQSGQLELELSEVDVAEVARDAVTAATPHADAKRLTLAFEHAGATAILGDHGRLAQLLDNLVANAIKFTPEGGHVTVRAAAEADAVVLEVTDSGIGIPEAEQERLFERFFRASTAVSQQIPGTGLGLHIVRAITEAHGGRVAVTSREGHGTTFRVELPPA